jgi:peptide/nickel transport system substrate-binding protein
MRRWTATAVLLAAASLLAACTKVGTSTGLTHGNPWTIPGVLRIAGVGNPDNLNPLLGEYQTEVDLSMFWGGYLFNWSDQNQWVPELATQMPTTKNGGISKDGLTIIYHLRKGVKWQDGAPFTADDVIFTWQAVMNPRNNVQTRTGYDLITKIDKIDDYTIAIHLRKRWSPFVNTFFTMSATPYPILPKHLLAQYPDINHAQFNSKPVGTGPFIVQQWQNGVELRMTANPNYWRGPPKLKEVDYYVIPDETTILTQLRTHEKDFEYNAPSAQLKEFGQIPGVRVYKTPFTQYSMIALNTRNPILSDVRVRQALNYALDKQELIDTITHGAETPGDSDQPNFLWAHASGLNPYTYNPAKAGQLLDQAGWKLGPDGYRYKDGQKLSLEISGVAGAAVTEEVEVVVQRYWRAVGVEGVIKNYQSNLFFSSYATGGIISTGKYDTAFYSWINGVDPDDSTQYTCDAFPPNGQNSTFFCNKDLDAAENVALNEYDQDKRKVAYDKIQRILNEQVPIIIMWYQSRLDVANTDLKNYKPAHAVTTFWNTWEWQI